MNTELFWEFIGDLFDNLVFRQAVSHISVYFWVILGHSGNIKGLRLMGFQTSPGVGSTVPIKCKFYSMVTPSGSLLRHKT